MQQTKPQTGIAILGNGKLRDQVLKVELETYYEWVSKEEVK